MDPFSLMIVIPAVLLGFAVIPTAMIAAAISMPRINRNELISKEGAIELLNHDGAMVVNGKVFPYDIQSRALARFIEEFDKRFPVNRTALDKFFGLKSLDKAKRHLIIEWVDGDFFITRDDNNIPYPEDHQWYGKVRGQFVSGNRVATAARNHINPPMSLGDTAFLHELNHWALKVTTGNSDPDHAEDNAHGDEWTNKHDDMINDLKKEFR